MKILQLIFEFFKTGLFSVGGGLATIPFLQDIAEKTGWYNNTDLANMIAVSESTPGGIGINMSSYVGYEVSGVLGAIIATFALITPAIIIVLIIARFLDKFKENKIVQDTFYGLRPASTGLIAAVGIEVLKISLITIEKYNLTGKIMSIFNWKAIVLAVILFYFIEKYKKHPAFYIVISAIIGIIFNFAS